MYVLVFRNACIPSLEENGTHHFRLFQTISTISNAAVQFLDMNCQFLTTAAFRKPRRKLLFGKPLLPRACLLHQLTNFTCNRILSHHRQPASFFFKKSKIFSGYFAADTATSELFSSSSSSSACDLTPRRSLRFKIEHT